MLFALGAVSHAVDVLESLTRSKSPSTSASGRAQGAANSFDPGGTAQGSTSIGFSAGRSSSASISPQTMSALIDAQSRSESMSSAPISRSSTLSDLFSQIDADGGGSITKSEFENALGAGGTNIAAADNVFDKLDADGDNSVRLNELTSAIQSSLHGHDRRMQVAPRSSADQSDSDSSADPRNPLKRVTVTLSPPSPIPLTLLPLDTTGLVNTSFYDVRGNEASSPPSFSVSV